VRFRANLWTIKCDDFKSNEMSTAATITLTRKAELESRIQENPFDYDAYRELIELAQDNAREKHLVRRRFQENFPLDERTWIEWLADLDNVGCDETEKDRLYELSLQDYLSPKLHTMHCQRLATKRGREDVQGVREAFKTSAAKCGAHFTQGHHLWNAWIQYEQSVTDGSAKSFIEYPMRRRGTSAIENVEAYWGEYVKAFPSESETYKAQFEAAKAQVLDRFESENHVKAARGSEVEENPGSAEATANPQLERAWLNYLDRERRLHPKKRPGILFERAVSDCCLSTTIWERYVADMEVNDSLDRDVVRRCLRNIPSASAMAWAALVHLDAQVSLSTAKDSLGRCVASLVGAGRRCDLFEPFLVYFKAVISFPSLSLDEQRLEVENILSILGPPVDVGDEEDGSQGVRIKMLRIVSKWLVSKSQTGIDLYKNVWNELHRLVPTSPLLWMEHIAQVRQVGEGDSKEILSKALHHLQGLPEPFAFICDDLLVESEVLSSEGRSLLKAKRTLDARVSSVLARQKTTTTMLKMTPAATTATGANVKSKKVPPPKWKAEAKDEDKMEIEDSGTAEAANPSRKRPTSSAKPRATSKEPSSSESVIPARKIRDHALKNDPSLVDIVFVPNLPDSATVESIQDFFSRLVKVPGSVVKRVQLKTRLNLVNKSTGEALTKQYAFVEFGGVSAKIRNQAAQAAVKLSGSELDDMPLTILLSNPPASTKSQQFKRARTREMMDMEEEEDADGGGDHQHQRPAAGADEGSTMHINEGTAKMATPTVVIKPRSLLVPRAVKVAQKKA